jgi:vacuolar-type H+-ATPase subunit I/STV1
MDDSKPNNTKNRKKELIFWAIVVGLIAIFFAIMVSIIIILTHTAFASEDIYGVIILSGILVLLYFGISKFVKSKWAQF